MGLSQPPMSELANQIPAKPLSAGAYIVGAYNVGAYNGLATDFGAGKSNAS